jgi:hypothetical protein
MLCSSPTADCSEFGPASGFPQFPSCELFRNAGSGRGKQRTSPAATGRKPNKSGTRPAAHRLLLFGGIRELALYRAAVLHDRGFTVIVPGSKEEAVAAIKRCDFEAAILTYTLSSDTVEELAELLRQTCPGRPLICISNTGWLDRKVDPDEMVIADQGPPGLLKALRRVLRR